MNLVIRSVLPPSPTAWPIPNYVVVGFKYFINKELHPFYKLLKFLEEPMVYTVLIIKNLVRLTLKDSCNWC